MPDPDLLLLAVQDNMSAHQHDKEAYITRDRPCARKLIVWNLGGGQAAGRCRFAEKGVVSTSRYGSSCCLAWPCRGVKSSSSGRFCLISLLACVRAILFCWAFGAILSFRARPPSAASNNTGPCSRARPTVLAEQSGALFPSWASVALRARNKNPVVFLNTPPCSRARTTVFEDVLELAIRLSKGDLRRRARSLLFLLVRGILRQRQIMQCECWRQTK